MLDEDWSDSEVLTLAELEEPSEPTKIINYYKSNFSFDYLSVHSMLIINILFCLNLKWKETNFYKKYLFSLIWLIIYK
jgi:hypothetical protein